MSLELGRKVEEVVYGEDFELEWIEKMDIIIICNVDWTRDKIRGNLVCRQVYGGA